ncbi:MAG: hypothetical protein JWO60_1342 [Frankiales bacterium]|nr:hypothetical protein [Frankiales bacterium]
MKRSLLALVPAAALAVVAASAGTAAAAGAAGTGSVTTVVGGTTAIGGVLSILGAGVSVTLASPTPGSVTSGLGATALTIEDLRGTADGWAVTATYSDVAGSLPLTGDNVFVSVSGVAANALGGVASNKVAVVTDQALGSPVTVATTASAAAPGGVTYDGSGITAMTAKVGVRMPVTAKVGEIYGGKVTYTVASVR